jgi:phosphoserine phosphatase RsbU/P
MTVAELEHFRNLLLDREHNIEGLLDSSCAACGDDIVKAQLLLSQIKDALWRVENHNYGECKVCHGEVELYRLEVQPVREVCLDCITPEEQSQLEYELFLASKIHRALLPHSIDKIEGFDIAVKSLAAHVVGGDYYDFLPSANKETSRIIIADVMGKGLPAGLLMSNVQGAIRILAEDIGSPRDLVSRLNSWLCRNVPITKFVSLACVAIQTGSAKSPEIVCANAGHCPPLILRNNGNIEEIVPTGGVLGVHEDFSYTESTHILNPGETVLLYTDGVTEAENEKGEQFGESKLIEFLQKNQQALPETLIENLLSQVRSFTEKIDLSDDLTVIALRKSNS